MSSQPLVEKLWTRNSPKLLIKLRAIKPYHSLHREQIMDLLRLEHTPETTLDNLTKAVYGASRAFEQESFFIRWLLFSSDDKQHEEHCVIDFEHIRSGSSQRVSRLEEAGRSMQDVQAETQKDREIEAE